MTEHEETLAPEPLAEHERAAAAATYLESARSDLVRGSLWTAATSILTLPTTFIANVLVARSLDPEGLGRFATYTAAFAIANMVSNLGWSEATVQWLASAGARGRSDEATWLIRRCAGYHVFLAGPASALTAFFLLLSSGMLVATVAASIALTIQILGTSTVIMTAGARNAVSAKIALVASTSAQLALMTTAVATHQPALTWTVFLAFAVVGPAIAAYALAPWERRALLRPVLSLRMPSGFFVYSLSACAAGLVASLVFGRSEVFVLRAHDLLGAAGIFTVVTGLASQMTGPLDSLLAPLTPVAAGLVAADRTLATSTFRRSLRISAVLGTLAACIAVPVGVTILEPLYGARYASASVPFVALGLVSCVQTVLGPVAAFAFATRSAAQVLRVNVICLAADAALALALIPVIGLWGAVVANASAQLASLLLLSRVVSRKLDIPVRLMGTDTLLFAVGLCIGLGESLACAALTGTARALNAGVVLAGLGLLWVIIQRSRRLQLVDADVAFIARRSSRPLITRAADLSRRAGLVQQT